MKILCIIHPTKTKNRLRRHYKEENTTNDLADHKKYQDIERCFLNYTVHYSILTLFLKNFYSTQGIYISFGAPQAKILKNHDFSCDYPPHGEVVRGVVTSSGHVNFGVTTPRTGL